MERDLLLGCVWVRRGALDPLLTLSHSPLSFLFFEHCLPLVIAQLQLDNPSHDPPRAPAELNAPRALVKLELHLAPSGADLLRAEGNRRGAFASLEIGEAREGVRVQEPEGGKGRVRCAGLLSARKAKARSGPRIGTRWKVEAGRTTGSSGTPRAGQKTREWMSWPEPVGAGQVKMTISPISP